MTRHSIGVAFKEGGAKAGRAMSSGSDWLIERFARMPMTNFLYMVAGYLAVRTCEHYMRTPGWEPSTEWLVFVAGFVTGAITQWTKKRTTDVDYVRATRNLPPTEDTNNGTVANADGADAGRDVRGAAVSAGRAAAGA